MRLVLRAKFLVLGIAVLLTPASFAGCSSAQQPATAQLPDNRAESSRTGTSKTSLAPATGDGMTDSDSNKTSRPASGNALQTATFGAGCFWCVEAVFQRLEGVEKVASGYMGGQVDNPTYDQVCAGTTGHAEVIQVTYDESKLSFATLLEVFWKTHDPTTLNRQGADVGTQYRSVVFYHSDVQKTLAESYKEKLNAAGAFANPIVTEVTQASKFYLAEAYHQNFWDEKGSGSRYCQALIPPKLEKLKKVFADKLKK